VLSFLKEKYTGKLALAVDVGCGSGQNTFMYADEFENVIGTDVSAAQVEAATSKNDRPNVKFEVHNAHEIPAENDSVQLITASTAAHWFDLPKFFAEGQRVLCQDGVMALYSYNMFPQLTCIEKIDDQAQKTSEVNSLIDKLYYETLGEYWDKEKLQLVMDSYQNVIIPMRDLTREYNFLNHYTMSLEDVCARIRSSSGFQTFCKLNGKDRGDEVVHTFEKDIYTTLGHSTEGKPPEAIRFNAVDSLFLVMARK
jgi:ubiquinone/menaquinone biosynthesis C-methylase UbiE